LFKSVYNNLSNDGQTRLKHLPSTDTRGSSSGPDQGTEWQLVRKDPGKIWLLLAST